MTDHRATTQRERVGIINVAAADSVQGIEQSAVSSAPSKITLREQKSISTTSPRPWAHFVAGGIGGMTSAILTSPLDVLKTRLQSDFYRSQLTNAASVSSSTALPTPSIFSHIRTGASHFRETFHILGSIHRSEGWRALFKGLGPNLIGVVPARAINFYIYGNGKRVISEHFNNGQEAAWVHLSAAVVAGIGTGTATNPIWVVKTRLQLDKNSAERIGSQSRRQYANSMDCIRQTLQVEGVRGLYRGLTASYLGVSESALQWVFYEQMKAYLRRRETRLIETGRTPNNWDTAMNWFGKVGAAGTAKFCAAMVTYPHEVIRTRLRQAPQTNGQMKYTGIVQCFSTILREEGITSLYGGLTPHILRVVPSAAIMFGTYELMLPLLGGHA